MAWALQGVLNVGLQIVLLVGGGWACARFGLLASGPFMGQINVLIVRVAFPTMMIYLLGIKLDLKDAEAWRSLGAYVLWAFIVQAGISAYTWLCRGRGIADAAVLNLVLTANNTVILGLPIMEATFPEKGGPISLLSAFVLFLQIVPYSIAAFEVEKWVLDETEAQRAAAAADDAVSELPPTPQRELSGHWVAAVKYDAGASGGAGGGGSSGSDGASSTAAAVRTAPIAAAVAAGAGAGGPVAGRGVLGSVGRGWAPMTPYDSPDVSVAAGGDAKYGAVDAGQCAGIQAQLTFTFMGTVDEPTTTAAAGVPGGAAAAGAGAEGAASSAAGLASVATHGSAPASSCCSPAPPPSLAPGSAAAACLDCGLASAEVSASGSGCGGAGLAGVGDGGSTRREREEAEEGMQRSTVVAHDIPPTGRARVASLASWVPVPCTADPSLRDGEGAGSSSKDVNGRLQDGEERRPKRGRTAVDAVAAGSSAGAAAAAGKPSGGACPSIPSPSTPRSGTAARRRRDASVDLTPGGKPAPGAGPAVIVAVAAAAQHSAGKGDCGPCSDRRSGDGGGALTGFSGKLPAGRPMGRSVHSRSHDIQRRSLPVHWSTVSVEGVKGTAGATAADGKRHALGRWSVAAGRGWQLHGGLYGDFLVPAAFGGSDDGGNGADGSESVLASGMLADDGASAAAADRRERPDGEAVRSALAALLRRQGGLLAVLGRWLRRHWQRHRRFAVITWIVLKNPLLWSLFVALAINLSGLRSLLAPASPRYRPELGWVAGGLAWASSITVPVSLFSNGVWLHGKRFERDTMVKACAMTALKLVLLAPLQLACAALCGLAAPAAMSLLLLAICPVASASFVLASQYGCGAELVTAVTILGIALLVPAVLAALALPRALGLYEYSVA